MKLRLGILLLLLGAAGSITRAQHSSAPRPIGVDDLFGFQEVSDAQISPDGQYVAYTVGSTSLKEDKSESRIWMVPISGGDAIPLTAEGNSSSHARWSPDGKYVAFLSERDEGKSQVYLLNRLGGEAQKLTDAIQDVDDFEWAPDGKRLVLILRDPTPEELEAAASKGKEDSDDKPAKKKAKGPWVIDRLQFKADTIGYLDRRRTHLYVFTLATKTTVQVSSGDFDDSEPAWSPDGKQLAFTSNRSKPDPDANYKSSLWIVAADNTDKGAGLRELTPKAADDHSASWSADGKWITYTTVHDPGMFQYATKHVAVVPAAGGDTKILTDKYDRMATSPKFSPDGKSVYFLADDDGTMIVAQVQIADGKVAPAMGGRIMTESFTVSASGTIAASYGTSDRPHEIFTNAGGKVTRISHVNDAWISQFKLSAAEYVSFKSKDGTVVHGFLYKPLDYVAGKKYPTLLRPHGGPVWSYYSEFQDLAQLYAANGYAVLLPNPRGSSGYGEEFCKAIWAGWGEKDYQDDMAMVDYAVEQGIADPDKLGVGGWSYGGISTDFIIGQTNRFKAAISGAGAAEFTSMWGHDQYQRDYTIELGYPWDHRDAWTRVEPIHKVKDILTPTLFVGGNIDWNVPILGGEQMYQSLKALGRETELVVYPDEYHEFKTPSHIRDLHQRFLAWYAHYVKADGTPARPAPEKGKSAAAGQ